MSDELVDLASGWRWASLADLSTLINGDRGKNYPSKSDLVASGIPFINAGHLQNGVLSHSHMTYITPGCYALLGSGKIQRNDILYCLRGSLGKTAIVDIEKGAIASSLVIVRPNNLASTRYLYYFLASPLGKEEIKKYDNGSAQPNLSGRSLAAYRVPLAPSKEQKRIADKLDIVLARVDACRERLDRIPAILKRFRQSVLAAATSGKMTEDWRQQLPKGLQGWESTNFADACEDITVGFVGKMSSEYRETGIPFLRSLNVRPFRFDPNDLRFISAEFHKQLRKSALKPGDVVVVRTGAPGQCCVIPDDLREANCSDLVIVRPGPKLLPEFACIFINSETSQSFVRSEQVGVAQLHFNVGSMKITPLMLPSLNEQKEIARRVQRLFDYADRIESRYTTARAQVERLTPALLAKAFRGELVPQDPNDEPADQLLERIRAPKQSTERAVKTKTASRKQKESA